MRPEGRWGSRVLAPVGTGFHSQSLPLLSVGLGHPVSLLRPVSGLGTSPSALLPHFKLQGREDTRLNRDTLHTCYIYLWQSPPFTHPLTALCLRYALFAPPAWLALVSRPLIDAIGYRFTHAA
jgi:hypothetical protein